MVLLSSVIVLPTVWLRDLSLLSFLSVGGIFASGLLVVLVGWAGATVTGFPHTHPPFVVPSGVPVALGLYSFCFSGEEVGQDKRSLVYCVVQVDVSSVFEAQTSHLLSCMCLPSLKPHTALEHEAAPFS
jgi:hypothetical protein